MARGGRKRYTKRGKTDRRYNNDEGKIRKSVQDRKKQARKSRTLLRQMRGMKWNEEEYSEEFEEELEDNLKR